MAALVEIGSNGLSSAAPSVVATLTVGADVDDVVVVVALNDGIDGQNDGDVTDSAGNAYIAVDNPSWESAHRLLVWYTVVTNPLVATNTVTYTKFTTLKAIHVGKITGAGFLDVENGHGGQVTATPDTNSSGALVQADEILIVAYAYNGAPTFTPPPGYSQPTTHQVSTSGTVYSLSVAYKVVASTAAENPVATLGTSSPVAGLIAAFPLTGGGGGGGTPANITPPSVSGSVIVGGVLTAAHGSWSNSPTSYAYQWQIEDGPSAGTYSDIGGETGTTYTVLIGDVGLRIRVGVVASN